MAELLPAPVRASIDATNTGDQTAFLATFADDGVVDDWGREFTGRDEIAGWSDAEFIGKHVTLEVTNVRNIGHQAVVIAKVGGDGFNGPSTFTYDVTGDQVAKMTIRE
ncbi:hypothetical protein GCM10027169_31720 [Gordonia jinhuaensis]|uniref:SnoaL-like domain-containing protein n=1 Tax=Gordonia jinhuaensis TaxID=1517702 RepID=A0A916WVH3_9ACTN|nr:nuclear transport factor 2 family protein [Gordonia jinhuaensis]GGB33913.1 hypothetical protein GCM10011489_22520 [Gordonia jinhuaensis]